MSAGTEGLAVLSPYRTPAPEARTLSIEDMMRGLPGVSLEHERRSWRPGQPYEARMHGFKRDGADVMLTTHGTTAHAALSCMWEAVARMKAEGWSR